MTATRPSSATAVEAGPLHLNRRKMKLIPQHHDDDEHGRREYRSPDGTWRVVRPQRRRNERSRWEVHERQRGRSGWRCHAAFERRRDALVFLDTMAVTSGGEA